MTKWEYCQFIFSADEDGTPSGFLSFFRPDGKHEKKEIEKLHQMLAQLGVEGWELVSHTQTFMNGPREVMASSIQVYILKRPIK